MMLVSVDKVLNLNWFLNVIFDYLDQKFTINLYSTNKELRKLLIKPLSHIDFLL